MKLSQLTVPRYSTPVIIYERAKTETHLRLYKRHKHKLLFIGNLTVPHLMLLGLRGYKNLMNFVGDRFHPFLFQTLTSIMAQASTDHDAYEAIDWRYKRSLLTLYIGKRSLPQHTLDLVSFSMVPCPECGHLMSVNSNVCSQCHRESS